MSDPALAFFVFGAFACVYFWIEAEHPDDLRIAAVFATGMLFTKNEGIGFWFILLFVVAVALLARRQSARLVAAAVWLVLLPLLANAAWFVFRSGIAKAHENYGGKIDPTYFIHNVSRVPEVLAGFASVFCNWNDWLLFWPLVGLILFAAPKNLFRQPMIFLFFAATLPLFMYGYVYVVTPWNLKALMEATANRLLLQIAPVWIFLLSEQTRTRNLLPVFRVQNGSDDDH